MAEFLPTALAPGTDCNIDTSRIAGEAITAGMLVYLDAQDNYEAKKYNAAASGTSTLYGVALNTAANNAPVAIAVGGTISATDATELVANDVGNVLFGGDTTAGSWATAIADVAAGSYTSVVGVVTAASTVKLGILNSGAVKGF
jgi:hypothetical protein